MANSYAAPHFSIDTSCNASDLAGIKGSAVATTDDVYVFNGATLTINQNISIAYFFINDNPALSAAIKIGYVECMTGDLTITLNSASNHYGLSGNNSANGHYKLVGTPSHLVNVVGVGTGNDDYNARASANTYQYVNFTGMQYICCGNAGTVIEHCVQTSPRLYAYYVTAVPASFLSNSIVTPPANFIYFCGLTGSALAIADIQNMLNNLSISSANSVAFLIYMTASAGVNYYQISKSANVTPTQLDRIDQIVQVLAAGKVE